MVNQGFLNLSKEEQERVLRAAIDEFAEKDYDSASLNLIIQKAKISKGSMYHYFRNKESLYLYVIERAIGEKRRFMSNALAQLEKPFEDLGFYQILEFQLETALVFAETHPQYDKINHHIQQMADSSLKRKIWEQFNLEFDSSLQSIVDKAIHNGEIRHDIDRGFVMRILRFVLMCFPHFDKGFRELASENSQLISREIKLLVSFLQNGLKGLMII